MFVVLLTILLSSGVVVESLTVGIALSSVCAVVAIVGVVAIAIVAVVVAIAVCTRSRTISVSSIFVIGAIASGIGILAFISAKSEISI